MMDSRQKAKVLLEKYRKASEKSQKKQITILLLGESGVGKSTFINAFANNLAHKTMSEAEKNVICVIPTKFTLCDPATYEERTVTLGEPDANELTEGTESATRYPRCYRFTTGDTTIRLIDTPGIGDTKGIENDTTNMHNLLNFLSNYPQIDAICILLRPNNTRVNVIFKYCILELLCNLNKSATRNMLFIFTNSRSTFYAPGDSAPSLRKVLNEIRASSGVDIPFGQSNIFCFDNESFRFLVAKSRPNSVRFSPENERDYAISWERNASAFASMMKYIVSLPPHTVEDTISINKARTSIQALLEPLGDITENIAQNMSLCTKHREDIKKFQGVMKELEPQLHIPYDDIVASRVRNPRTVCTHNDCSNKISILDTQKVHYRRACHESCNIKPKYGGTISIVGNLDLLYCKVFSK